MKKIVFFLVLFLILASAAWGQVTFVWIGVDGAEWDDKENWEDDEGDPVDYYPGEDSDDDIVIINGFTGTIQFSDAVDITIKELTIEDSEVVIDATGEITIDDLTVDSDSDVSIETDSDFEITGTLSNDGIFSFSGTNLSADTLTNTGTLNFSGTVLSANALTNSGTFNFDGAELSADTLTNTGTFNFDGDNLSANALTNSGTLDLGSADLSVGALTNTGGLIKLQGSQTVSIGGSPPAARIGGTIQYQGNTSSPWSFGYLYTNLIVDSSSTMGNAGALDISDTANFGSAITATSVTVGGASTISANVTTTETQNYSEQVELDADVTLTSTTETVTLAEIIGNSNSLTITGNGVLNGGSGIGDLSVSGNFSLTSGTLTAETVSVTGTSSIAANVTTTGGTQNYTGAVTLVGTGTRTLTGTTVTFGTITGNAHSLTITGNGVLNGGSDINNLSVSGNFSLLGGTLNAASVNVTGTSNINENIITTGNQNYGSGNVTIVGTRTLTSSGGSITAGGVVNGTGITVNALQGISLAGANTLGGSITLNNTQTGAATGDITFNNTSALGSLTSRNNNASGEIIIDQTGNLPISSLQTGVSGSISVKTSGAVTQTGAITTSSLTVEAGTGITLTTSNNVTTSVDLTSTAGDIEFINNCGSTGKLTVTTDTPGNITITEKSGGIEIEEITQGVDVNLKANIDLETKGITVSGIVTLEANENITVDGDITAYQLIAIASGVVTVGAVEIDVSNIENEGRSAAIYIEADNFIVTSAAGSIVPGGTGGQLCLALNKKWTDVNSVVNGCEEGDPLGTGLPVRWHQHFIDFTGKDLLYGDGTEPPGFVSSDYITILDTDVKTKFVLDTDCNVYIYNAKITSQNILGLTFETSGTGSIELIGTNEFTKLTLKTVSGNIDINEESGDPIELDDITAVTSGGVININVDITTTGTQTYTGVVTLGGADDRTLEGTTVTLGVITGNAHSLTINGDGVLNGGSGINDLTVNGTTAINANISTTGTQTYSETVTLGGTNPLLTLQGTTVTFEEAVTGNGKSLTITGNGVLNGVSGVNVLFVSGTTAINEDITTTGTQSYTGAVTFDGTNSLLTLQGSTVTLGAITGNGKSLTITGNGVLNGISGVNVLSVSGTTTINQNITTTATQTYTGAVTLGGTGTKILQGTTVTLGTVTGNGNSLTITGIGVLNGISGVNVLSVSGTTTINADIDTTGNQTYTGAATLDSLDKRTITSQNGNILFSNTLTSTNAIELLAENGNITISGKTISKQLIAKASTLTGVVRVNAVEIDSVTHGNEDENAAIYIEADDFIITASAYPPSYPIVPGGTGGQLCLRLNKKWTNSGYIDGDEDNPDDLGSVSGARWHQHFVLIIPGKILYSFTEDSDGNGKLDRIRVQTNVALNNDFTGFKVSVIGYEIDINKGTNGFRLVSAETHKSPFDDDSFYIYLIEKTEFGLDGGNTPHWSILSNTTLEDTGPKPDLIGKLLEDYTPIDTIPPRIAYTLTLPGKAQTYAQMSEPVSISGAGASFGLPTQAGSIQEASTSLGYLFNYSTAYGINDLVNENIYSPSLVNGYFRVIDIVDKGNAATDLSDPLVEPDDYIYNKSPKYPVKWGYMEYVRVSYDGSKEDANGPTIRTDILIPPNTIEPVMRRITDVLVNTDDNYFALPIWAKPSSENISITQFDGSAYLEKESIEKSGIELQARIGNGLSITPQLFWTTADIPASMRNPKEASDAKKVGGLWLPNITPSPLYYYVPLSDGIKPLSAASSSSPLFNYDITAGDLADSGAKFEFIFRRSSSSNMFIARLDGSPNAPNWYTLIRPFSFDIQGVRYQRGGVTILNNVINSDKKETAFIRYDLPRSGRVTVQIYTLDGTLVKSIRRNETREAGAHVDEWDGSNNGGRAVARGMYFVRVVGPDIDEIRKIMVVK